MGKNLLQKVQYWTKKVQDWTMKRCEIRETKFAHKLGAILVKKVRKLFSLKLKLNTKITLNLPPTHHHHHHHKLFKGF